MADVVPNVTSTLNAELESLIKGCNPKVVDEVKDRLVRKEVDRRAGLLIDGLTRLRTAEVDIRKVDKPVVAFNADSSEASRTYTKDVLEAIKKATEKRDKLLTAMNKAIDVGDYQQLEKQLGGKADE